MTDTARHTPGPWHASVVRTHGPFPGCDIGAANGRNVAMVHYDTISREDAAETRANARLIAAAPDLLALAETVVSEACRVGAGVHPEHPLRPLLETARAAIAKATGDAR